MKIDAVILGGGGVEEWFANESVANKGMLDIAGKPSVSYPIKALRASPQIDRIILIGDGYPDEIVRSVDLHLPDSSSLKGNIDQGFEHAKTDLVLITTSDIPLVTDVSFSNCLDDLLKIEGDLFLPILTKNDTDKRFPGTKRTYAKLIEGKVKIGNLFLLKKEAYIKVEPIVEETGKRRKSAIKQALQLGIFFLIRLILIGNVSIPELEKRVSKILGVKVKAPILPYPELGVDVDKPSDLEFCRAFLETKHGVN